MRRRARLLSGVIAAFGVLRPSVAAAAEEGAEWLARKSGYVQLFATGLVGSGLRFNNPYRLATPLGETAESISRTATYTDFGGAMTLGDPFGVQHGVALRASFSLEGVSQAVLTPSYLLYRRWRAVALLGRGGVAFVLTPSRTTGFEASAGGIVFLRGGIGVLGELVANVFYGAGTREQATPVYPVLSAQAGLVVAYEALP